MNCEFQISASRKPLHALNCKHSSALESQEAASEAEAHKSVVKPGLSFFYFFWRALSANQIAGPRTAEWFPGWMCTRPHGGPGRR